MLSSTFLIRIGFVILFLLLLDIYAFNGVKTSLQGSQNQTLKTIILFGYWAITIAYLATFGIGLLNFDITKGSQNVLFKITSICLVLIWLPKLVFCLFLLFEDVFRLFHAALVFAFDRLQIQAKTNEIAYFPDRRKFISQLGLVVATIPFGAILYGVTKGKYNYVVRNVELFFKDLPASFDGLTITQISDIHSGSLDDVQEVQKGIDLINAQKSDIVVFTGDLVNNVATEFHPWIDVFSKIEAPLGKYSITGNHDYGEYVPWPSETAKNQNFSALLDNHSKMGFKILMNENVQFTRNNDQITLVGIENWGLPPFPQKGDINKAIDGVAPNAFKILLSHDPSHWDAQVLAHPYPFHLTLAGHTHGMQFGIEVPGFKWSPVKYKYPRWAGLYKEAERYLYVNRGFGFIGFPGRVGIWPEITKFTLRTKV